MAFMTTDQLPNPAPKPSKDWLITLVFLAPWLLVFMLFQLFPISYSIWISFTDASAFTESYRWVGFANFVQLFGDGDFLRSLRNSALFVIFSVPFTIALAVGVSFLLHQTRRLKAFYQFAFFAPSITSLFVIANLFSVLYSENGFFNELWVFFGQEPVLWLKSVKFALGAIAVMNIWASFGFYALLFLSSLQGIPKEYYEIAALEGHKPWATAWSISLPLIWPMVKLAFLLNAILAFQVFGEVYVMTQGGPVKSTETAVFYIFEQAFAEQKFALSSAAAYVVCFILILLTLVRGFFKKSNPSLLQRLKLKKFRP